jgi:hypothetical protein
MKRFLLSGGLVLAGLLSTGSLGPGNHAPQTAGAAGAPWQAGRCYRVLPENRDQLYTFKVIERSTGAWIHVQPDPKNPRVPGARPEAELWLNANAVFTVQEWNCSD